MHPFSWPVVLGTFAVGSPALWAAQVSGTLSPDVALMRLLVCLGAVWVAFSVVAMLSEHTVNTNNLSEEADAALAREAAALEEAVAAGEQPGEGVEVA